MHEIEPLHVERFNSAEIDRAGVVDENVDAAECFNGFCDCGGDLLIEANIAMNRQTLAARLLDLRSGSMDRSGKLGVFGFAFRRDSDIGAVAGRAKRYGEAYAPACASDE